VLADERERGAVGVGLLQRGEDPDDAKDEQRA